MWDKVNKSYSGEAPHHLWCKCFGGGGPVVSRFLIPTGGVRELCQQAEPWGVETTEATPQLFRWWNPRLPITAKWASDSGGRGARGLSKSWLLRDECSQFLGEKCPGGQQLWPGILGGGHLLLLISMSRAQVPSKIVNFMDKSVYNSSVWSWDREKWKRIFAEEIHPEVISHDSLTWWHLSDFLWLLGPVAVVLLLLFQSIHWFNKYIVKTVFDYPSKSSSTIFSTT